MSHPLSDFYRRKRVLVTGHTGFEGGWAVAWLKLLGAQVCGYGLPPATRPNFFDATLLDRGMTSIFGDIRDRNSLANTFTEMQPEIVIHYAALTNPQSALSGPVDAFSTNVMGTVHMLEEARLTGSVKAIVLVSNDSRAGIGESSAHQASGNANDLLRATMNCAELARSAFTKLFQKTDKAVATARIAAAIGGGDWREGLVPDLIRAMTFGERVRVREQNEEVEEQLRIWHVLEPVCASLCLAQSLFERGEKFAGIWEFMPSAHDRVSASEFSDKLAALWEADSPAERKGRSRSATPNASRSRTQAELGWSPVLSLDQALALTVEWYRGFCVDPSSILRTTETQIKEFMRLAKPNGLVTKGQ